MPVTLVMINSVGQRHMILKPKGRKVHQGVEKPRVINMTYQTGWSEEEIKSAAFCSNNGARWPLQPQRTHFLLAEEIALAQAT